MATTTRSGQNIGAALTRLHLVEEKLKHLDPSEAPDLTDLQDRMDAAEALLQRYWEIILDVSVPYTGVGVSGTPADTTVFDTAGSGLVRAIFGAGGHGMASNDLIDALTVSGKTLVDRIRALESQLVTVESRLDAIDITLASHASRILALELA